MLTKPYDLPTVLQARRGIVCAVGAGGKKTTLYQLAQWHSGRVGITTTVQLPPFPRSLPGTRVIATADELVERVKLASQQQRIVAFAHPSEKYRRVAGISVELLASIQAQARFDVLLVKADGARQKPLKAPAYYEPVIPPNTDTVLLLLSAGVIGQVLRDEIAHRIELIEEITGARRGQAIGVTHLARLLTSERGLLKGVGDAQVIPIINQVDDAERRAAAVALAQQALMMTDRFAKVVLASMRREQPIVDIID